MNKDDRTEVGIIFSEAFEGIQGFFTEKCTGIGGYSNRPAVFAQALTKLF